MKKIISYFTTPVFCIAFGLTLILFHPILVLCRNVFGYRVQKFMLETMNHFLLFDLRLAGTKFRFINNFEIPTDRPLIIVSNHQSMFDIPLFVLNFKKNHPRFISKKELARGLPSISYTLRTMGSALIDRKDPNQALLEIEKIAKEVKDLKCAVCVFPEGTRARDGNIKKFKTAGLKVLIKNIPEALIVPVVISGNWEILKYHFWPVPFGTKVTFKVLKPFEMNNLKPEEICEKVESMIKTVYQKLFNENNTISVADH